MKKVLAKESNVEQRPLHNVVEFKSAINCAQGETNRCVIFTKVKV